MQAFEHLRLLVHRCAHRLVSATTAVAAAATAAAVGFAPVPEQHRLWMCRPKRRVMAEQSEVLHRVCAWERGRLCRDLQL